MRTDQELAAYIGLDWGDQRHAVQIQAAAGGRWNSSSSSSGPTCCTAGWPSSANGLAAVQWGSPSNSAAAR